MDGYAFTRFTDRTVTNLAAFETELEYVRKHGFGRNDREEYDHFVGISAPVFNYLREPVAVLNLWSVYPTHSIDDLTAWGSDLRAAADRVTAMIGGVPVE